MIWSVQDFIHCEQYIVYLTANDNLSVFKDYITKHLSQWQSEWNMERGLNSGKSIVVRHNFSGIINLSVYGSLVIELIKHILYMRLQIPLPYKILKHRTQSKRENVSWHFNFNARLKSETGILNVAWWWSMTWQWHLVAPTSCGPSKGNAQLATFTFTVFYLTVYEI